MLQKTKQSKIKEIMQRNVLTVNPDQSLFHASVLMASKNIGILPVIKNDGTLVGILSDRDIITRCIAVGKDARKTKVFECMTSNPTRTVPSQSLGEVAELMSEFGTRRLPVVENDKLIGIVSISDIAKVSSFCPNEKHPDESCILLNVAKELQNSSHLEQGCTNCHL